MAMSLVVVFSLMCVLSGCQKNDQELIVGSWTYEIEGAENFNEGMEKGMGEELVKYFKVDSIKFRMIVTYKEDGTYSMEVDENFVPELIDKMEKVVRSGLEKYFEDAIRQAGMDLSVDEFLELSGTSLDAAMEEMFSEENVDELIKIFTTKQVGKYKLENGKIYWTTEENEEFDEESYDTYKLEGDALTLLECFCKAENTIDPDNYPVVCTRVKE